MTGSQSQAAARKRLAPTGPKIVQYGSSSTTFNTTLSVTTAWKPGDWVYVWTYGRQNSVFDPPTNVGSNWIKVLDQTAVGGAAVFALWRCKATTTSSGSVVRTTRSGNSVAWFMYLMVVRGADQTEPEDFLPVCIRPGVRTTLTTVGVDPQVVSKPNCLSVVMGLGEGSNYLFSEPLQQNAAFPQGIHELSGLLATPSYSATMIPTSSGFGVNWIVVLMVLRSA